MSAGGVAGLIANLGDRLDASGPLADERAALTAG